ncbi:hypothetical protein NVP1029O_45 [Vibrio phage 1.029.O._10N.261.55.A7]|nr:hypothetical protein NVP1029O_45 [Vibrio phage 1.029.O._10N.261.55.A7]
MNKAQWLNRYEDAIDCAYQDTSEKDYPSKQSFIDDKWDEFKIQQDELAILNAENSSWT